MSVTPSTRRSLARSAELLERARGLIPGASQTVSKGPTQWAQGVAPAFVERAEGVTVWDVDGNAYLDFPMGLGPVILGHAHPAVNEAIARQLRDGITYTLPHRLEVEVAERIRELVPCAERVRFGKTGSDATSAAVRVARAVTGRERVIAMGYHGWHDWYVGSTSRRRGVPEAVTGLVESVPFGDAEALRERLAAHAGEVACVVLEPVGLREPHEGELQRLCEIAREHGALAVFDEVISGFRLAPGGAQERYGAVPDLACFGKALGNGMPVSALAGKGEYMDVLEDVFFSGTHGGEALSLAAVRATLDVMRDEPVYEHLWRLGGVLQAGLLERIAAHGLEGVVRASGAAPWTLVVVREPHPEAEGLPAKTLLQQELLRRGVLFNGSHFIAYAHTDADIERALAAYDEALAVLAGALPDDVASHLEGPPVAQVFRAVS
jgi:glutamate-1-semialdehyde 2,1-aminomutase/spore coat polysaccharide biosynthesis protein SpsF